MLSVGIAQSQTLQNTRWKSYYAVINDTVSVVIDTDTFRSNSSNGTNLVTSWISITNDSIFFADVSGSGTICPLMDTGLYTFTIENDTLAFIPVYDSCMQRSAVLSSTPLWRDNTPPAGIDGRALAASLHVFPNPSHGIITVNTPVPAQLEVADIHGRLVRRFSISQGRHMVPLNLPPGVYIASFHTSDAMISRRLIVD